MQAIDVTPTHPEAPYDALRPMRCRAEIQTERGPAKCTGRGGDIDWSRPDTHGFKCPRCKAFNIIRIVEASDAR